MMIIYIESSICRNEEMSVYNDTNEDNLTVIRSLEVIKISYDDCAMNWDNSNEELDTTHIYSKNDTMCSSHIHNFNVVCKFYLPFLSSTNIKDISSGTGFEPEKLCMCAPK